MAVTVRKSFFDLKVYGSIRHIDIKHVDGDASMPSRAFIFDGGECCVGLPCFIQKVASS